MKRKVTIGDTSKTSQGDTTPPRRPSVFERLGPGSTGLSTSDTHGASYSSEKCRNWLRTGACEYGRSCKYQHGPFSSPNKKSNKGEKQNSRTDESDAANKDRKKKGSSRNNPPKLISPSNKKSRRRSKTRIHKPEPESKIKSTVVVTRPTDKERDDDDSKGKKWSNDKSHLDFQEELDLEKRRQQLQRELALELQKERMAQEREKVIIQKTVSSSSSSSDSSSTSRSSSSSSSSDDNRLNSSSSDDSTDSNAKRKNKRERLKSGARRFTPAPKEEPADKSGAGKKVKEKSEHVAGSKSKNQSRRISKSPVTTSPKSKGPRTPSPPPKHRHKSPDTGEKDKSATGKTGDKYNRKKRSSSLANDDARKTTKRWSKSPPTPELRRSPSPVPGRDGGSGRKSRRGNRTPSPSVKKAKKKSPTPEKNRKPAASEKGEKKRTSVSKEKEVPPVCEARSVRSYSPDRDHDRHHHARRSLSPREDAKKSDGFREEKDKKRRLPLRESFYKKGRERREAIKNRGNKNQERREPHNAQPRERESGDADRKRNVEEPRRSSPFRRGAGSPARHPVSVEERDGNRRRQDRDRDEKTGSGSHREERRDDTSRNKRQHAEKEPAEEERKGYQRDKGKQDGGQEAWEWNRGHNKSAQHEGRRSASREKRADEVHREHRRGFDERGLKDDGRRERDERERDPPGGNQVVPRGERRPKERVRDNLEKLEGRRRIGMGKGPQMCGKEGLGGEKGRRRWRSNREGRRGRGKGNRTARRLRAENANLQPLNKEPQWKRRDEPIEPRKRPRTGDRLSPPPAKHSRNDPSPSVRGPAWADMPIEEQREPREPREPRELREPREPREPREMREPREPREPRDPPHRERESQDWNVERKRNRENDKQDDEPPKDEGYRRREPRKRRRSRSRDDKRDEKRPRRDPSKEPSQPKTSAEPPVKLDEGVVDEIKDEPVPGPVDKDVDGLSDWSDDADEILNMEEDIVVKDSLVVEEAKECVEVKPERKDLLDLIEESRGKRRSSSQEKDGGRSRNRERHSYRSQPTSRNTSIERRSSDKIASAASRSRSIDRNAIPPQVKEEEVTQLSDGSAGKEKEKESENILENDDYEAISDDDLETMIEEPEDEGAKLEREAKNGMVDSLEVDWSCLTARPKAKNEAAPGSALRRFSAVYLLSRIGVLPQYGGKQLLDKIKEKCEEQLREEEEERGNRKTDCEVDNSSKLQLTFESSYSNSILFAKIKDSEQKSSVLTDIGSYRRALCARRDLQLRKQLYKVTEKIPSVTPQSFDNEMYKLSVQLFKQRKIEQEKAIHSIC